MGGGNFKMSNRYYVSSNELYHWKYIKREKKNGKWVYYYDTGANAKKNYEQAKQKLDTYKRQEEGALARGLAGKGHEHSSGHAMQRYVNSHYKDYGPREKLEKQYEEAKSEYYDSPMGKKEQRAENLKRTAQKVKDWAKDKLGYDEKQAASAARTKATIAKNEAEDIKKENDQWKKNNPDSDNIREMADWQTNYYRELAGEAKVESIKADIAFSKTPLAKLEAMKESIDAAKDWVSELFEVGHNTQITGLSNDDIKKLYKKKRKK